MIIWKKHKALCNLLKLKDHWSNLSYLILIISKRSLCHLPVWITEKKIKHNNKKVP